MLSVPSIVGSKGSDLYKKFVWDEILRVVGAIASVLVIISLGEEFFFNRGLSCFVPSETNRDQAHYIMQWCTRLVREIDRLPMILFGQSLALLAPHLIWETYASPALAQFFTMTPSLSRLRDRKSGQYSYETVQIVKLLQNAYRNQKSLFITYQLKLWVQFAGSLGFLIGQVFVYYLSNKFEEDLSCEGIYLGENVIAPLYTTYANVSDQFTVQCTYTTASLMRTIWIINLVALSVALIVTGFALAWCFFWHWDELDPVSRARFAYFLSMNPGAVLHAKDRDEKETTDDSENLGAQSDSNDINRNDSENLGAQSDSNDINKKKRNDSNNNNKKTKSSQYYNPSSKYRRKARISNDLDFLVMLLFCKDRGLGESFFEVQIDVAIESLWAAEFDNYTSYFSESEVTNTSESESPKPRRNSASNKRKEEENLRMMLYEKCSNYIKTGCKKEKFKKALHLYCGSKGCSIKLLYLCEDMIAVDFNEFYNPESAPTPEERLNQKVTNAVKGMLRKLELDGGEKNRELISSLSSIAEKLNLDIFTEETPGLSGTANAIVEEKFATMSFMRVPENIMSKDGKESAQFTRNLAKRRAEPQPQSNYHQYDLVVITCLEPHFRVSAARAVLGTLFGRPELISHDCLFLIVTRSEDTEILKEMRAVVERRRERRKESDEFPLLQQSSGAEVTLTIAMIEYLKVEASSQSEANSTSSERNSTESDKRESQSGDNASTAENDDGSQSRTSKGSNNSQTASTEDDRGSSTRGSEDTCLSIEKNGTEENGTDV
ncbi:uncharacterized protein [Oscarella lobularis]|uniref:uncharacterized protein isoform X2 n=1 Tax=Oscarella lobularis TaxID=121494 RepID=UPI0033140A66